MLGPYLVTSEDFPLICRAEPRALHLHIMRACPCVCRASTAGGRVRSLGDRRNLPASKRRGVQGGPVPTRSRTTNSATIARMALQSFTRAAEKKGNLAYNFDMACAACARGPSPNTENDIFVFREACHARSVPANSASSGPPLCSRSRSDLPSTFTVYIELANPRLRSSCMPGRDIRRRCRCGVDSILSKEKMT